MAMKEKILEACSDPTIDQRWWTKMWSLNILPKGVRADENDVLHSWRSRSVLSLVEWVFGLLKEFQVSMKALQAMGLAQNSIVLRQGTVISMKPTFV
ncbi:hypothetical protein Ddye_030290 [Dipteronia dyeriana]|uniref:Uncharacterized protein n=1 Tax=Dipteronia dyeriana TaxID=168575 RepID=A0AAD9TH45_9ROSI|nr:hypothetical protein Ddye_030290 [Dipteronia dyeriana]